MSEQQKFDGASEATGAVPRGARAPADPRLVACRDMALQLLMQSFDGFFARLDEDLLDRADKANERSLRDSFFAARAEAQAKRALITAEFRQRFLDSFNNRVRELEGGGHGVGYIKPESAPQELALVANDEYEESLTASHVVNAFKQKSGDDLQQLEARLARLLPQRGGEAEGDANLISPEAICEAMLAACRQIQCGVDARIVALRAFEQQLASQVAVVYRQVNEFLVQQNVQPVNLRLRAKSSATRPGVGDREELSSPVATEEAELPPGMVNVALPAMLAAHLEQLLSGDVPAGTVATANSQAFADFGFLDQLQHRLPDDVAVLDGMAMHPARDNLVSL